MIYWFTGEPGHGKTVLGNKLFELLKTEKRNWRKSVFHVDDKTLDIYQIQSIVKFIHESGCDVVVSCESPNRNIREAFKNKIGNHIQEIYVYRTNSNLSTKYEPPVDNFFGIDTTRSAVNTSFNKLISYLTENDKI